MFVLKHDGLKAFDKSFEVILFNVSDEHAKRKDKPLNVSAMTLSKDIIIHLSPGNHVYSFWVHYF